MGREAPGSPTMALEARRAEEMARYTQAIQAPLLARLEAQAERIGRLEAELEQARAQLAERPIPEAQQSAPPKREGRPGWWPRLVAWMGGA